MNCGLKNLGGDIIEQAVEDLVPLQTSMNNLNLPSQFGAIPRYMLSYPWPSPIHLLPKLTQSAYPRGQDSPGLALWVKREDQAGMSDTSVNW